MQWVNISKTNAVGLKVMEALKKGLGDIDFLNNIKISYHPNAIWKRDKYGIRFVSNKEDMKNFRSIRKNTPNLCRYQPYYDYNRPELSVYTATHNKKDFVIILGFKENRKNPGGKLIIRVVKPENELIWNEETRLLELAGT
jgi:hypothetical protein